MQDNGQREGNLVNLNFNRTSSISEGCIHDTYVKDCEAGWERQEDHCYLWATAKKNWTAAEDFCQQEGGHLASVASDATMSFVLLGAVKKDFAEVWLGGSDIGEGRRLEMDGLRNLEPHFLGTRRTKQCRRS